MAKRVNKHGFDSWLLILIVAVFGFGAIALFRFQSSNVCANTLSCKDSLAFDVENGKTGTFNGRTFAAPKVDLAEKVEPSKILGEAEATGEKRIDVDLTTQTLSAYQGDSLFMQVPISSGKWFPTPTGEFTIWEKIRATKMSGGQGADYYYLPNVPFVMFFSGSGVSAGRGFSLHGAYWHNNFGHPMSHGCVNMRIVDAQKLYYWVNPPTNGNVSLARKDNPGTKITIHGQAPI